MWKLCYVIKKREITSCKNIFSSICLLYYSFRLGYFHKLYIGLKRISCRIEWFLFQLHSPKHARVIVIILLMIHKAIILAFQSQGVKAHFPVIPPPGSCIPANSTEPAIHYSFDITQQVLKFLRQVRVHKFMVGKELY